ncbi:Mor transcription activator family protein [Anaerocolumna jejuensis DSM 15929]|uniref:Mor transcription activator family protein n=1 Tax=Anaerocolumna jejuensis DSM 15929 TaxID=1121322 RepID=A0A1M7BL34_9FIRM|nr:Mor transcription activator family protein [Anaerocolumna jejuensis]SHL55576.1 Mor transcription activator family protein [Anaerocolumna jejuensis DSM 15929]
MESKEEIPMYNGIYEDMVDYLGLDITIRVFERYKGQQVTFPVKLHSMDYIISQVSNISSGKEIKDIARKYDYSEQWIRRMIRKKKLKLQG